MQPEPTPKTGDGRQRHPGRALRYAEGSAPASYTTARDTTVAGYAGAGKTTVLRVVFRALQAAGLEPHPMALAGRAARRLSDVTGLPARTIASVLHRPLVPCGLERNSSRSFNERDVLVIDEASMVDLPMLWSLTRKVPKARLLLVGDPAQLPPIGPGKPFHDLLGILPSVILEKVHRQAEASGIPAAARDIREGRMPDLPDYDGPGPGVCFIDCSADATAREAIRLARSLSRDTAPGELQILAARKARAGGVHDINDVFSAFRGAERPTFPGNPYVREGDPIIFTQNDWERGLTNGALGRYLGGLDVEIEGVKHTLDQLGDAERIDPAYAMTIHKSQGSQWRRVIVAIHPSRILDRSALYTAITRATEQVILLGNRGACEKAVTGPNAADRRQTALKTHVSMVAPLHSQ